MANEIKVTVETLREVIMHHDVFKAKSQLFCQLYYKYLAPYMIHRIVNIQESYVYELYYLVCYSLLTHMEMFMSTLFTNIWSKELSIL